MDSSEQRRRRPRRGLVAGLVLAVLTLLVVAGSWYLGSGRYTTAPPVLGLTQAAAQTKLASQGLTADVAGDGEFSEDVASGLVLSQDPGPNQRVRKDGTVSLVLSRGPDRRTVPDLAGTTQAAATRALTDLGLRLGKVTQEFSSTISKGSVIRTTPAKGEKLRPGSAVALAVSRGVEQLPVPDVRGKSQDDAQDTLRKAGFDTSVTTDIAGVELAGTAKNAAALAAAVAGVSGPNAAGAAAGKVFAEIDAFARTQGASPQTFAGLAGAGDLVATVVAEGSRNRRAGELLGQGMSAESIGDAIGGQSSEALEGVALLAKTLRREGVPSPTLDRLVALVDGRIDPEAFTAHVTAPPGRRLHRAHGPSDTPSNGANGAHRNGSSNGALAAVAGDAEEPGQVARRG